MPSPDRTMCCVVSRRTGQASYLFARFRVSRTCGGLTISERDTVRLGPSPRLGALRVLVPLALHAVARGPTFGLRGSTPFSTLQFRTLGDNAGCAGRPYEYGGSTPFSTLQFRTRGQVRLRSAVVPNESGTEVVRTSSSRRIHIPSGCVGRILIRQSNGIATKGRSV